MRQFSLLAVLISIAISSSCQKLDAMEYVVKDSLTLSEYKSKIPGLIQAGKTAELAQTYKRIADYYYQKWFHDSLLYYYKLALQKYEIVKDSFHMYYCCFRIGELIASNGKNPDESLSWHLPGIGYFERIKEYHMAAYSNYAVSTMYKAKGEMQLRQKYLDKAIEWNKLAKDTLLDIIILSIQCDEWMEQENWNQVLIGSQREIELSRLIKQPVFIKIGLVQISKALLHFNKPEEALPYLEESAAISKARNTVPETYRLLVICHLRLNRSKEAEKYLALYKHSQDSIARQKENDNYQELLIQYETEKKQATIAALERENKLKEKLSGNQKLFIILLTTGLLIVLLIGWVFYGNYKRRQRLEEQLRKQQEQFTHQLQVEKEEKMLMEFNKQLAEVQLTALSAQMNPHFIFNCMNSIQKYVLKNEKGKALEFLQNFSDLMRSVLDNSVKVKVALDEEMNMLEKYILLEQQRLESKFDYRIEISPDLQADFFEIPGMIIQPYVENAIWHGLMNLPNGETKKGLLLLRFNKEGSVVKCMVEDNGVGRKKAAEMERYKSPKRKSYGMAIAQKRLELLQKENEEAPEIVVEDLLNGKQEAAGTRVTIFIHVD